MAQRKSPSGGKPVAKKGTSRPGDRPVSGSSAKPGSASRPPARKATPARKPGKSIVNQKQTPWGLIASIAAVVLFAAAVIVVVVATHKSSDSLGASCGGVDTRYCLPELPAAKQIKGVTYKVERHHTHVPGTIKYDATPPIGGNHSQYWADCSGTVYPHAIANENAVHALEHGAVWVTYRQGLPASQVATLAADVKGRDHVFMSPYPNLRKNVSLQAWGYQLFVDNVSDPRISEFIAALADNSKITPEVNSDGSAISCAQPTFKTNPSTFGHPLWVPTSGTANTMTPSASA